LGFNLNPNKGFRNAKEYIAAKKNKSAKQSHKKINVYSK